MSFSALKKSSASSFAKLTKEIEKISNPSGGGSADERFWKPELDKSGNGYAVLRFLPAPDGEDIPFAKIWFMRSKVLVVGTLRTLSRLSIRKTP